MIDVDFLEKVLFEQDLCSINFKDNPDEYRHEAKMIVEALTGRMVDENIIRHTLDAVFKARFDGIYNPSLFPDKREVVVQRILEAFHF